MIYGFTGTCVLCVLCVFQTILFGHVQTILKHVYIIIYQDLSVLKATHRVSTNRTWSHNITPTHTHTHQQLNKQNMVACLPKLWMVHAREDLTLQLSSTHRTTQLRRWDMVSEGIKSPEPSSHWWLAELCASTGPWTCPDAGQSLA